MKDKKYNKGGMVRGGNASKRAAEDYEDFGKKGKTSAPRKSPIPKSNFDPKSRVPRQTRPRPNPRLKGKGK